MAEKLSDFLLAEPIFVDANIFDYHHANHPRFRNMQSSKCANEQMVSLGASL